MRRNKPLSKKIYSYFSRIQINIIKYYEIPFDVFHNLDYRGIYYKFRTHLTPSSGFLMDESSNFLITENDDFLVY